MSYCGYITTLNNVRKHPNADRMKLADCFGNTVCVGLDAETGDRVIYFPTDGQLSVEYCAQNDLVRRKDAAGNNCGGYLDPDKRNVRAINLRGEKSDGLVMPLESLEYTGVMAEDWSIGDTITVVNGHEICCKYIPRSNARKDHSANGNKTRKRKDPIAPLFQEHVDTEQLAYNLSAFKPGDEIEITLKMHGTSQRTANLPVLTGYNDSGTCKLANAIRKMFGKDAIHDGDPVYEWGYTTGTRRVVLDSFDGGFYGSNEFREQHSKFFEGKLWKGETVYYEVVGFTHTGTPIMASCDNKKIADKEFMKQYGAQTVFSYGCDPKGCKAMHGIDNDGPFTLWVNVSQSDIYVYRMTMTNEDGQVVEYTPDFMRYRCEQMGVKTVPVFYRGFIEAVEQENDEIEYRLVGKNATDMYGSESAGSLAMTMAECFYDGPDPVGRTHVREGVVVRIINRPKFCAYKHKNHNFKVLEGIIKDEAAEPDMEEAQNVTE